MIFWTEDRWHHDMRHGFIKTRINEQNRKKTYEKKSGIMHVKCQDADC